jgi:hypothetical protein
MFFIIIIIIIIIFIADEAVGLSRFQGLKLVPSTYLSDVRGVFCHSVYIDTEASGFGFLALFPNVVVTSFDHF